MTTISVSPKPTPIRVKIPRTTVVVEPPHVEPAPTPPEAAPEPTPAVEDLSHLPESTQAEIEAGRAQTDIFVQKAIERGEPGHPEPKPAPALEDEPEDEPEEAPEVASEHLPEATRAEIVAGQNRTAAFASRHEAELRAGRDATELAAKRAARH